jgi:UDP:flavonoid glycosyltransferase YjiC (YdhE family)
MSARIVYAWEMGANFGHIGAFLPIARVLRDRGHDLQWVVTQTGAAARLLSREGFVWSQAPVTNELIKDHHPITYADILLRFGYSDSDDLLGLVVAWRERFRLGKAELVVADHAPTAVLAARTMGLPVVLFSTGFTVPPPVRPLPNMRPWEEQPEARLLALEDRAMGTVNHVLAHFEKPPLNAFYQLFETTAHILATYPELDHYEGRGEVRYWHSAPNAAVGVAPAWPDAAPHAKRIFAYLRNETPHAEAALRVLHRLGHPTVIYFPDMPPPLEEKYRAPHLVISPVPVDLEHASRDADLAITYASLATTTAFLLAGTPLLLLPRFLEQFIVARRVVEMGAGRMLDADEPPHDLPLLVMELLLNAEYTDCAAAFAAKYAGSNAAVVIASMVRCVEEALPSASP